MDFMKCEWEEALMKSDWEEVRVARVFIFVKDFPDEGVLLEDLKPLVHSIREKATDMIIRADLSGVGLVGIERFKQILVLIQEVVEYTKEDNLLRKIEIQSAGFIFRTLYGPISLAVPTYFRDMIQFI
jgi:hypothetical protein